MCEWGRGAKAGSTLRCSQAVPHPSTNRALCRLTSEVERDPVHSTRYGRQRQCASEGRCPGGRGIGGGACDATRQRAAFRDRCFHSPRPRGGQMPKEPRPSLASQRKPERARGSRREPEREPARARERERERERERARLSQRESASSRSPLPFPQTVPTRARAKAHRAPQGKHRPKTPPREA